jgi:hypothetical protein
MNKIIKIQGLGRGKRHVGADVQAAGGVWVHGLQRNVSSGHNFFGSVSPIKTDATFFLHKTLKPVFADFHREISPLSVSKNHRRLYG